MKRPSCWLLFAACACALYTATNARSFTIENDRFVADGSAVQLIAGWHVVVDRVVKTFSMHTTRIIHTHSVHYFRIPRPYWRDRLQKLKAMGLNSIEVHTYIVMMGHTPLCPCIPTKPSHFLPAHHHPDVHCMELPRTTARTVYI